MSDDIETLETAFIIGKRKDGSYFATVDVQTEFLIDRSATRLDVKRGTQEILEVIQYGDITGMVIAAMNAQNQPASEKTASSIRKSLKERDIL